MQTRHGVLHAAAEVFEERGFAGASISQIIQRAGVTAGALYFHFASKDELAEAVKHAQPDAVIPHLEAAGLQRLVDLTLVWSFQMQADVVLRAGVRLVTEDSFSSGDPSSYDEWVAIMAECLEEARARGELQAGVEPREVGACVVATCTGLQLYSAAASGRTDLPERVVNMWHIILPGIAVPAVVARTVVNPERVRRALTELD